ncbi:MAG: hypothetical protein L0387_39315, partial [Acidobacteria bacterium]|nr:hypothetical protein [Acidobacteriota bacterium]
IVTSMTAPVASGWSDRRVGLAPTGKRRLITAHTQTVVQGISRVRQLLDRKADVPSQSSVGSSAFVSSASA